MSDLTCSVGFHVENPGEEGKEIHRVLFSLSNNDEFISHSMSANSARSLATWLWLMADGVEAANNG